MVEVMYSQRHPVTTELMPQRKTIRRHQEACEVIDHYPWEAELAIAEETGEGDGFYFLLGDQHGKHASFQFVPMDINEGWLMLDIVVNKGMLGLFGKKTAHIDFDTVTAFEAKDKIKDLFNHTVESLYEKYKG